MRPNDPGRRKLKALFVAAGEAREEFILTYAPGVAKETFMSTGFQRQDRNFCMRGTPLINRERGM